MAWLARVFGRAPRADTQPPVEWPGHGTFRWERPAFDAYGEVEADWLGRPVAFIPDPTTFESVSAALPTAEALIAEPERWQAALREVCLRDGYPLWQGFYRSPDGPPLTPAEWWDEFSIMFVTFDTEGRFEFMLYGGDGPANGMKFVARGDLRSGFEYATD